MRGGRCSAQRATGRERPALRPESSAPCPTGPAGVSRLRRHTRATRRTSPTAAARCCTANRTHLIFWQPGGLGPRLRPRATVADRDILADVAADSHKPTNVYGLSGQYGDAGGPAAYNSTYGGAVVATDPLPAQRLLEPPGRPSARARAGARASPTTSSSASSRHVISRQPPAARPARRLLPGHPERPRQLRRSARPTSCALGGTDDSGAIAAITPRRPIGAPLRRDPVQRGPRPLPVGQPAAQRERCRPGLSTLSHEHNEMVTDPLGDAWIDSSSSENGDLCLTYFGPTSAAPARRVQRDDPRRPATTCRRSGATTIGAASRATSPTPIGSPPRPPTVARSGCVHRPRRDPDGSIVAYGWFFGDGHGHGSPAFARVPAQPGAYRVVLRPPTARATGPSRFSTIRVSRGSRRRAAADVP